MHRPRSKLGPVPAGGHNHELPLPAQHTPMCEIFLPTHLTFVMTCVLIMFVSDAATRAELPSPPEATACPAVRIRAVHGRSHPQLDFVPHRV